MLIGIVGSSGGSVVRELIGAAESDHDFAIVTDRSCGLESVADEFSLPWLRINEPDNARFSLKAKQFFDQQGGADLLLLFYLRLVTQELFSACPTFNLHPSLLPDYQGFKAIERAHADRVEQFGATLHLVDETTDHGPIVARVSTKLKSGESVEQMCRISFAQKTYLALYLLDRLELEHGTVWHTVLKHQEPPMNPTIRSELLHGYYDRFAAREGLEEVV
jgi:phosphoribosylglycinamide formyltransferase 1